MATVSRERTIGFYEILAATDGGVEPFSDTLPVQVVLAAMDGAELPRRRVMVGDQDLIGSPHWQDDWHLLLHKVKSATDWLSRADFSTGQITELETRASEGYLDTTAVVFAPFGNVVGIMQGSVGAPSHRSLESWLNKVSAFAHPVAVQPLMSQAQMERLGQADAARSIEIKTSTRLPLTGMTGGLASAMRRLKRDYGDAAVTIKISIPRGKPKKGTEDDRTRLYEEVQELAAVLPRASRATVGLLFSEGDDYGRTRLVELVEHHITAKRNVLAVDDEGRSIRIREAIRVIMTEIETQQAALQACVTAPL